MSDAEKDLMDYLQADLTIHKYQLATYRRAFGVVAIITIAFLTCAGACMWSIYGLYKSNSDIIQQAMAMQSVQSAMCLTAPQNTNTRIEISLP